MTVADRDTDSVGEKPAAHEHTHLEHAVPIVGEEDGRLTKETILAYIVSHNIPIAGNVFADMSSGNRRTD